MFSHDWKENILPEGHSYVHDPTWHWTDEKHKFASALPPRKDSLREKECEFSFDVLSPASSQVPSLRQIVPCFPQSNISQQEVPVCFSPFVPQFHLPGASSPHSMSEPFLTKTSTWTILHSNVEGEMQVSQILLQLFRHLTSQPHADFLSTETFKLRIRHLCPSLNLLLQQLLMASVSWSWKGSHWQRTAQDDLDWDLQDSLKNDRGVIHCASSEICVQEKSGDKNAKFNL